MADTEVGRFPYDPILEKFVVDIEEDPGILVLPSEWEEMEVMHRSWIDDGISFAPLHPLDAATLRSQWMSFIFMPFMAANWATLSDNLQTLADYEADPSWYYSTLFVDTLNFYHTTNDKWGWQTGAVQAAINYFVEELD